MPQKICDTAVYPLKAKVNTECPLEALLADTQNASSPLAAIRVPPLRYKTGQGPKGMQIVHSYHFNLDRAS